MATALEVITAAHRESNLLGINASVSTAQQAEGLARLNSLIPATVGNEIGTELRDLAIGGTYDQSEIASDWVPENARMVLNLSGARTFRLHPNPYEGQRLAVVDALANLATNNLTLDGNGRRIEGGTSLTLSTDGQVREWLYRGDIGEWRPMLGLVLTDELPFPVEFDDYFIMLLALRLNPRYGQEMAQATATWMQAQATRLEARYRRRRDIQDWGSLGLLNQNNQSYGISDAAFNRGRGW